MPHIITEKNAYFESNCFSLWLKLVVQETRTLIELAFAASVNVSSKSGFPSKEHPFASYKMSF